MPPPPPFSAKLSIPSPPTPTLPIYTTCSKETPKAPPPQIFQVSSIQDMKSVSWIPEPKKQTRTLYVEPVEVKFLSMINADD
jgi:hypothetical protein